MSTLTRSDLAQHADADTVPSGKAIAGSTRAKIRRSIDMSAETSDALDRLQVRLGLDNHSQVIRKSLQVLEVLAEFQDKGITIYVAHPSAANKRVTDFSQLQQIMIL